jgi:hypothetical protein
VALGINYESTGGDFLPIVKFDCRAGRMFRRDRANGENTDVDITRSFKAVVDLENLETGWMNFDTGGAPEFAMAVFGKAAVPDKPSDKHRLGVRLVLKLHKDCGGDVREFAGNAKSLVRGVDGLHDAYLAGVKENQGKLPVVVLEDTTPITTGEGARKSTNYAPVFKIVNWVSRPEDLVHEPRSSSAAPAAAKATNAGSPPSTGSTRVPPPAAAPAADDDFG